MLPLEFFLHRAARCEWELGGVLGYKASRPWSANQVLQPLGGNGFARSLCTECCCDAIAEPSPELLILSQCEPEETTVWCILFFKSIASRCYFFPVRRWIFPLRLRQGYVNRHYMGMTVIRTWFVKVDGNSKQLVEAVFGSSLWESFQPLELFRGWNSKDTSPRVPFDIIYIFSPNCHHHDHSFDQVHFLSIVETPGWSSLSKIPTI